MRGGMAQGTATTRGIAGRRRHSANVERLTAKTPLSTKERTPRLLGTARGTPSAIRKARPLGLRFESNPQVQNPAHGHQAQAAPAAAFLRE
jgi:hypothetical protein